MIRLRYQAAIIFFLVWIVFANSLPGKFVMDDASLVVHNPRVHSLINIPRMFLGTAFFDPLNSDQTAAGQFYRPLVSVAYALIYALGGPTPWIYHFFQVLLHIANTILVLLILRKFISPKFAFWMSLVFAVHPINQMSVAYISSLNDVLYLFFGLSAIYLIINQKLSLPKIILISGLLFASSLSKETGILFLIISMCYLWLFNRKQTLLFIYILTYFLITYVFLRFALAKVTYVRIPDIPIMRAGISERLLTMPKIFWYYLGTFIFPMRLIAAQWWTVRSVNFPDFILPLSLDLLFLITLLFSGRFIKIHHPQKFSFFVFFCFWFLTGVGLHLQIWPLDWTVLDTWFYFPFIGLLALIGLVMESKNTPVLFIIPFLVLFSIRTITRNSNWRDGITLFTHDLALENNGYLEAALAGEYTSAKNYPSAVIHWQKALKLNPWGTPAWYNLGYVYEQMGDFEQARKNYAEFLRVVDPAVAYESLLTVTLKSGDFSSNSVKLAETAVEKYPQNPRLWILKSVLEYFSGDSTAASASASRSYDLQPSPDAAYILQQIKSHDQIKLSP